MLSREEITSSLLSERLAVIAYLSTITRSVHLAEDVFQDVCVKVIGLDKEFESTEHLLNWVRLAGKNRAIDLLRARDGKYVGLSEEALEALSAVWSANSSGLARERELALQECLRRLTPNSLEILRLRYFEGRSGGDVADMLGRKLETVYQALSRIHKTLGECVRRKVSYAEGES